MTEMQVCRGVPASGKSTHARALVANTPGWVRVNRDDIRRTMFGKPWGVDEAVVTDVENAMIESALRAGTNVVVDATNLSNKHLRTKLSLASRYGAVVTFKDFPITLTEAIGRDVYREDEVGYDVIEGFFRRYKINMFTGELPAPPELLPVFEPYVRNESKGLAYIVDTDGTVANHEGVRSPYDTTKYAKDTAINHVASIVDSLSSSGFIILALSGRDEEFREVTETWWWENDIPFDKFFMRPAGDKRMDAIIKYELFKKHIEPNYNVLGAFDDRPQVIRMWETIGVPVLNVGDGREF